MIFDVLTLAFGPPALLYAGIAWFRLEAIQLQWVGRIAAVSLVFVWLTLETATSFTDRY